MRIGEVAQRTRLPTSRIRFYEARGLFPKPVRSENGYRDYLPDVIETLGLIEQAQSLGFSLVEIKAALAPADGHPPSASDLLTALRTKLAALDQHIEDATERRQRILMLIAKFEGGYQAPISGRPGASAPPTGRRLRRRPAS